MGDIEFDVGGGEFKAVPEDGDAGDAIDVVVAIDDDFLFLFQCDLDSLDGGFDSAEAIGFEKIAELRVEEFFGFNDIGDAAVVKQLGDEVGDVEFLSELVRVRPLWI